MKKVTLEKNETIKFKLSFGKRILFYDFFIIVLFFYLNHNLNPQKGFHLFISIIFIAGIIAPMAVFMILNLIRIITHRVYLSNLKFYYFKGFIFKRITIVPLNELTELHTKQSIFLKRLGLVHLQLRDINNKKYFVKGIKNYQVIMDYLAVNIKQNSDKLTTK